MPEWMKPGKALVQPPADSPYGDPAPTPVVSDTLLYAQFVAPDDHYRPELAAPFTVFVGDQPYTIATNGHRMIALPGDRGFPKAEDTKRTSVPKMLATMPELTATVDLAELRKFVRATTPETCTFCDGKKWWECEECNGTGSFTCVCTKCDDEYDSDCEECDGTGTIKCDRCTATASYGEIVAVKIGEHVFNRANVIPAVRYLTGERVALHLSTAKPGGVSAAAHLVGDSWHVLLMPLRADKEFETAPVFALPNGSPPSPHTP